MASSSSSSSLRQTSFNSLHNHLISKMPLSMATYNASLSFSRSICSSTSLFLHTNFSNLSLHTPFKATFIRMGGGPRTFPGGVSKWQWKRMQAKKSKQLLKARLSRERQIYDMRKRAELKAAVSELERPWEVVAKSPTLFSVRADEQVKVLADRFQKPGGFDMWTERDGPQLFETPDGIPTARFFPKGVVHSVKPYGKVSGLLGSDSESKFEVKSLSENGEAREKKRDGGRFIKNGSRRSPNIKARNSLDGGNSGQIAIDRKQRGESVVKHRGGVGQIRDGKGSNGIMRNSRNSKAEPYDMSLQKDGSYGF